ncbi:hypothetical protein PVAP13_4NG195711 [Panicum virgatum]|uniref:Uncharacterized protein n=1 Tax=Panicum virgatum TaxID=38727 RepID=A0A8T0TEK7_PANVG|nr:hypothetical protein PVAP13_4NG195711 [Panicum virgatum]
MMADSMDASPADSLDAAPLDSMDAGTGLRVGHGSPAQGARLGGRWRGQRPPRRQAPVISAILRSRHHSKSYA